MWILGRIATKRNGIFNPTNLMTSHQSSIDKHCLMQVILWRHKLNLLHSCRLATDWYQTFLPLLFVWNWRSRTLLLHILLHNEKKPLKETLKKKLKQSSSITRGNCLGNSDLTAAIMDRKPKIESMQALSNLRYFDFKFKQIQNNVTFQKAPGNTNPY